MTPNIVCFAAGSIAPIPGRGEDKRAVFDLTVRNGAKRRAISGGSRPTPVIFAAGTPTPRNGGRVTLATRRHGGSNGVRYKTRYP